MGTQKLQSIPRTFSLNAEVLVAQIEHLQRKGNVENRGLRRELEGVTDYAQQLQLELRAQNFAVRQLQSASKIVGSTSFGMAPGLTPTPSAPPPAADESSGEAKPPRTATEEQEHEKAVERQQELEMSQRAEVQRQHDLAQSAASGMQSLGSLEDPLGEREELARMVAELTRRAAANAKVRG